MTTIPSVIARPVTGKRPLFPAVPLGVRVAFPIHAPNQSVFVNLFKR